MGDWSEVPEWAREEHQQLLDMLVKMTGGQDPDPDGSELFYRRSPRAEIRKVVLDPLGSLEFVFSGHVVEVRLDRRRGKPTLQVRNTGRSGPMSGLMAFPIAGNQVGLRPFDS